MACRRNITMRYQQGLMRLNPRLLVEQAGFLLEFDLELIQILDHLAQVAAALLLVQAHQGQELQALAGLMVQ